MGWFRAVFRILTIVGTYTVAFAYVGYRAVRDRRFWASFLRGRL